MKVIVKNQGLVLTNTMYTKFEELVEFVVTSLPSVVSLDEVTRTHIDLTKGRQYVRITADRTIITALLPLITSYLYITKKIHAGQLSKVLDVNSVDYWVTLKRIMTPSDILLAVVFDFDSKSIAECRRWSTKDLIAAYAMIYLEGFSSKEVTRSLYD